ncbi:hypothetical protein AB9K41_01125, partial [Cribrihabitans sp. XS_ASV171]
GITSAVYISFAADRFAQQGMPGIPERAAPALMYILYGLFGLSGVLTDRVRDGIGLPWLLRLLLIAGAVSLALVAMLPGHWLGLVPSAALQGVNVMMTSAVLAFWSERLYPSVPALGFTAVLLATAAGSVIGPALAGMVAQGIGAAAMFCGTATIPLAAAAILRAGSVTERPVDMRAA